ncbi:uncharacterized protein LOC143298882 [Babylonia areolata]|uniref:uncharacterized protein LOC143298882 n=1 Tax=Babylonia areolata TaxID=304850 RepID=UPI003FD40062
MSGFYVAAMAAMMVLMAGEVKGAFNEPDWGFQSYLDEDFSLRCNHSSVVVEKDNHVVWMLPSGDRVDSLDKTRKERFQLSSESGVVDMVLTIKNVQDTDSGVYLCYVYERYYTAGEKKGPLLRGLNLGGPMYREPFDKYRDNLMVGGLAAVVLFVPLVTACFVYKFRFQTKEQKAEKRAARLEATKHRRHLENNGKGQQLSDVSVTNGKGESNPAYESVQDSMDTHL